MLFLSLKSMTVYAQPSGTIVINPNLPANPLAKPGFNLVFHDEFSDNTIDPFTWNIATSNPANPDPCNHIRYDNMRTQVREHFGICELTSEEATTTNNDCGDELQLTYVKRLPKTYVNVVL